jgi:hypothetical protein
VDITLIRVAAFAPDDWNVLAFFLNRTVTDKERANLRSYVMCAGYTM